RSSGSVRPAGSYGHRLRGHGGGQQIGKVVDLRLGAALGDRHQQTVVVLGVLAAERVAGGDAPLGAALEHAVDGRVEAQRELASDGRFVQQLDTRRGRKALARVSGAPDQQLTQFTEARV